MLEGCDREVLPLLPHLGSACYCCMAFTGQAPAKGRGVGCCAAWRTRVSRSPCYMRRSPSSKLAVSGAQRVDSGLAHIHIG
eukprot:5251527-Prymnesium_polylepis.2